MSKIILKHILEKHFGKNHPKIEYALIEINSLYYNPLNNEVNGDSIVRPAYEDASKENLDNEGRCRLCGMVWYNCLCAHEN